MMRPLLSILALVGILLQSFPCEAAEVQENQTSRPNILIAMSDDQSFPHTSISGSTFVNTPAFDRIAREGILFTNAIAPSPGCGPSRASFVLGRYPWQNEHAGNHDTVWPKKFTPFTDLLEDNGYFVGYTGKGVTPCKYTLGGRDMNPAGLEYNQFRVEPRTNRSIDPVDYARNFEAFLDEKPDEMPFCFQLLAKEPHREFKPGSGLDAGKKLEHVVVPPFLPDTPEVRSDLLDYALEIEWFDQHLARCLKILEQRGELENTIIIVTSDNGMAFPSAKALCTEYGIHVPLAVAWPKKIQGSRVVNAPVSLVDIYPTLFDLLSLPLPERFPVSGRCLSKLMMGESDEEYVEVYSGRERHSSSRWMNLGYPQRCIRTEHYLYIWNFHPERWPAGSPQQYGDNGELIRGFCDVDSVTLRGVSTSAILIDEQDEPEMAPFFQLAYGKRPQEELYDVVNDPGCLHNLVGQDCHQKVRADLRQRLFQFLRRTRDPRVVGPNPDVFESYRRYGVIRSFPQPDWVAGLAPKDREELVKTIATDTEPIIEPDVFDESGLRLGRYQLHITESGKAELYDLRNDPETLKNLADKKPRVVKHFLKLHQHVLQKQ